MVKKGVNFKGFPKEMMEFFVGIAQNNNKTWYEEHKGAFKEKVLKPIQDFILDLSSLLLSIDPDFELRPEVGKTISRIYRDIRFSKDKSPYNDHIWLKFGHPNANWADLPGFYFSISPRSYSFGMGYYQASKETMEAFRIRLVDEPKGFRNVTSFLNKTSAFKVGGEKYKKLIKSGLPQDIEDFYQRKNFWIERTIPINEKVFGRGILDDVWDGFAQLAEFYHYLKSLRA